MKEYYDLFVELSLQQCTKNDFKRYYEHNLKELSIYTDVRPKESTEQTHDQ